MGHSEVEHITKVLESHQQENRLQLSELRESTSEMAKGLSTLATTLARVEERHASHDDGLKRVGRAIDDHETRLRTLEGDKRAVKGSWKAVVVIVTAAAGALGLAFSVMSTLSKLAS